MQTKILVTGQLHDIALQLLRCPPPELGLPYLPEVVFLPDAPRAVILEHIVDTDVLVSRSETDVDAALLRAGKKLKVVARAAVGYGNIDCELATELGILVVNTPGQNTNSAAELTMGLLLALVRNIPAAHAHTSSGGWDRHRFAGNELAGKTIGLVGLGNVGHRVARFSQGFDMKVAAYDPYISDEIFRHFQVERKKTLRDLLAECDILSLHVPLNKETRDMITATELGWLKRGALVLNAARGGVINEGHLLQALDSGHLKGAALDTFVGEPKPLMSLVSHPNVIVTPHIGASTEEAQYRIGKTIAVQVLKALRGEIVDFPVNLPHVSVMASERFRSFAVLCEKIAHLAAQIFDFQPSALTLKISADTPESDIALLRLACLKGFLSSASEEFVSYVNAERLLARKGIVLNIETQSLPESHSKDSLLFEVRGNQVNEKISVGGVLYDSRLMRLSSINGFLFETELEGEMILMQNHDRPGVVGDVGSYLAKHQVNIAQFELSRNRSGGEAMSLIRADCQIAPEFLGGLRQLANVISVRRLGGL